MTQHSPTDDEQYVKGCLAGYQNALIIVEAVYPEPRLIRAIKAQIDVEKSIIEKLDALRGRG